MDDLTSLALIQRTILRRVDKRKSARGRLPNTVCLIIGQLSNAMHAEFAAFSKELEYVSAGSISSIAKPWTAC
jgi:hypothetical protein